MFTTGKTCTAGPTVGNCASQVGNSKPGRCACCAAPDSKLAVHSCLSLAYRSRPFRLIVHTACRKSKQYRRSSFSPCCSSHPGPETAGSSTKSVSRRTLGLVTAAVIAQARFLLVAEHYCTGFSVNSLLCHRLPTPRQQKLSELLLATYQQPLPRRCACSHSQKV